MPYTRVEVRCCCRPKKLLGWLEVDAAMVVAGRKINFAVERQALEFGKPAAHQLGAGVSRITLDVAPIVDYASADYPHLALKSNDTPIEVLRRVVGFVENHEP